MKKFFTGKVKKWAKKVQTNSFSEANYRTSVNNTDVPFYQNNKLLMQKAILSD